jgi:hypothetical protein
MFLLQTLGIEVYGFVRYAKVRDVDKLLKALNNVCFGQYCVRAVLARFDRKVSGGKKIEGVGGKGEGGGETVKMRKKEIEGEKSEDGSRVEFKKVREAKEGDEGVVKVGSVLVQMGGERKKGGEGEEGKEVSVRDKGNMGRKASTDNQSGLTRLVRKYRSTEEDLNWASRGLIGTVIDGESIPLIQIGYLMRVSRMSILYRLVLTRFLFTL